LALDELPVARLAVAVDLEALVAEEIGAAAGQGGGQEEGQKQRGRTSVSGHRASPPWQPACQVRARALARGAPAVPRHPCRAPPPPAGSPRRGRPPPF